MAAEGWSVEIKHEWITGYHSRELSFASVDGTITSVNRLRTMGAKKVLRNQPVAKAARALTLVILLALMSLRTGLADEVRPRDDLYATLWKENSVEYRANTIALFALAQIRLNEALADPKASALDQTDLAGKPPAIIVDVDDTLLDTGPFQSWLVREDRSFDEALFEEWKTKSPAPPIPGALDFAKYADSQGVAVFYVTNRHANEKSITLENFEQLGFPLSDTEDRLLMLGQMPDWTSKKTNRRHFVGEKYRVLLLIGDHWGDVSDDSQGTEADRHAALERNIGHVGKDWLTLSNPTYGLFLSAPYFGETGLSADEKRQKQIDALRAWSGPDTSQ